MGSVTNDERGTTTRVMPSSPALPGRRAATTTSSASSASKTNCFSPSTTTLAPSCRAVAAIPVGSKLPAASATARVPATPSRATAPRNRRRCSASPAARTAGTNCVAVARNGAGHSTRPELLAHHGQLDEPETEPAVVLGDGQGGPVQLDHPAPQLLGVLVLLHHTAHEGDRALALEDGAHRFLQGLLVVGELEFHRSAHRDHEGVDGHRTLAPHDDGVEVELDEPLTARRGQPGHGQDHVDERLHVGALGGRAPR